MSDDTISKPRAKRIRLLCQGAALVCVAAGVAAVLIGVPFMKGSPAPKIDFSKVEADAGEMYQAILARRAEQQTGDEAAFPPDLAMISEALGSVENAPKAKVEETEPPSGNTAPDEGGEAPKAVANARTRFVGTIGIGDRLMALVTAGGSQRILGEGDEATLPLGDGDSASPPTITIRSVTPERVVLVEDGVEQTIERAPRTGFAVSTSVATVSAPEPTTPQSAARTAGSFAGDNIKPVDPDDYRREDGTIDYDSLREAARERARQRQELRRQRRDEENGSN